MIKVDANYWITKLALTPHPEGGYYRRSHTSFAMDDFEMGEREALLAHYPEHAELIKRLAR